MKTHKMEIRFWEKDGEIHINFDKHDIEGVTGMSTINNKERSKRNHNHLYNQLRNILIENGKWKTEKL